MVVRGGQTFFLKSVLKTRQCAASRQPERVADSCVHISLRPILPVHHSGVSHNHTTLPSLVFLPSLLATTKRERARGLTFARSSPATRRGLAPPFARSSSSPSPSTRYACSPLLVLPAVRRNGTLRLKQAGLTQLQVHACICQLTLALFFGEKFIGCTFDARGGELTYILL